MWKLIFHIRGLFKQSLHREYIGGNVYVYEWEPDELSFALLTKICGCYGFCNINKVH